MSLKSHLPNHKGPKRRFHTGDDTRGPGKKTKPGELALWIRKNKGKGWVWSFYTGDLVYG